MKRFFLLLAALVVFAACTVAFQPADSFKPGKLSKAEVEALRPGVTAVFFQGKEGKPADIRVLRLPVLFVPEGKPATVLMPAGPFRASISGLVKVGLRGDYQFRLEARGEAKLLINGKQLLKV